MVNISFFRMFCHLIIYIGILSGCLKTDSSVSYPLAQKGVINLQGWDFKQSGPATLNGTWEFYWGQHLNTQEIAQIKNGPKKSFIKVPDSWVEIDKNDKQITGTGFATYHLVVLLDKELEQVTIRFDEIGIAYKLFINGKSTFSMGKSGVNKPETTPRVYPIIIDAQVDNGRLELTLQVSNFHVRSGGIWYPVSLGEKEQIHSFWKKKWDMDLLLMGVLLIMTIYHFTIYFFRKKEKSCLFFSLVCLVILLRSAITGERILVQYFTSLPWVVVNKLAYLSLPLGIFFMFEYIKHLFPEESSKLAVTWIKYTCLAYALLIIITPAIFYTHTLIYSQIFLSISCLYLIRHICFALKKKRPGALLLISCFIILSLFIVNDILYANMIITTGYYIPFGILLFIIFQAFILTYRYTTGYNLIEKMIKDLKSANESLQNEIKQRKKTEEEKKQLQKKIEDSLTKVISGYIPICSICKSIREDDNNWKNIELFIEQRSEAKFSHGMCQECSDKLYSKEAWYIKMKKKKALNLPEK